MPGPFEQAGVTKDPTKFGALSMGARQFTGLWTQRSPYRDADVPYLYGKFYSASRYDSILDGINREITSRLTDKRRPGSAVFNSNAFPAILSYYSFKFIQNGQEIVRLMVDTELTVYEATGGTKTTIWVKAAGAGPTRFTTVGATLYMTNGVENLKLVASSTTWQATTSYAQGQYIVDTNGNLQLAQGSQTANVVAIQADDFLFGLTHGRKVSVWFSPLTPLEISDNISLTLAGLTTLPTANGATPYTVVAVSALEIQFFIVGTTIPITAYSAETGTATTGTGITGGTQPTWATGNLVATQDGGLQWVNLGPSVQQWGDPAPTVAPSVTQAQAPSIYPNWAASTWYAPLFVILQGGVLYQLTTSGTTGASIPTFNATLGATTTDGTAVWTSLGPGTWASNTAYAVNQVVLVTFTFSITYVEDVYDPTTHTYVPTTVTKTITVTNLFQCTGAGTSGNNPPNWTNGIGTTVTDGTVVWTNLGQTNGWSTFGATQALSTATEIVGGGYLQTVQELIKSGATQPTWETTLGAVTQDGIYVNAWSNQGALAPGTPGGAWTYAWSGKDSITGDVTTASPLSTPISIVLGNLPIVSGPGLVNNPPMDTIVLWRTAQGQSTLVYLDEFPNPGVIGNASSWVYTDTTSDLGLDALIPAPVNHANDPPPVRMTAPAYHLQRIWAIQDNAVVYSGGPDALVGNGNDVFPPLNRIAYPAKPIRLVPVTLSNGGLLVFTTSGVWVILGTGTASNPFYTSLYEPSVGILGYTALDVLGATIYLMENNGKVSSFDPQSGYTEIGFPIGDQFEYVTTGSGNAATGALYNPATAFVSWNIQSSGETAMYVSDGAVGWFRFSPIAPPESGSLWSPRAAILGGTSAVQSIETSPGVFDLLIGPATSGPILKRDKSGTIWTDVVSGTATAYPSWDAKGVTLLCTTGSIAEIAWIAAKSTLTGARPTVSLLMGEIQATTAVPWDVLQPTVQDPADLPESTTVFSDRYSALQNGIAPKSDALLTKFDYGAQNAGDELLEFAIYGAKYEERTE